MSKKALVTGVTGQDGAYLSRLLLENGYDVIGTARRTASGSLWRLEELGISNDVEVINFELAEFPNMHNIIESNNFDEIYNLAAQSFVKASFDIPVVTTDITGLGVSRMLECVKEINPSIRFYQASSSEMFGKVSECPQTEETRFHPRSPYGVAKLFGHWMTVYFRNMYNMFAVSGILFNHESPLRGEEFVTRKIVSSLAKIKYGISDVLEMGNLEAKRDWGFAGDYVNGMWLMLQQDNADDYVLATGETHSVREFIEVAAPQFGFDIVWKGNELNEVGIDRKTGKELVRINPKYFRPAEVDILLGDPKKAKNALGWQPKVSFEELVLILSEAELIRAKKLA